MSLSTLGPEICLVFFHISYYLPTCKVGMKYYLGEVNLYELNEFNY